MATKILRINSIPLKKVMMTPGACLKKTVPLKILDHCSWLPEIMMVSLKCMAASAPLEAIRLK